MIDCPPPDTAALLRINATYFWRHGRLPNLAAPTRFTELVQLRKLYDRDPRLPRMADKVSVKAIVADTLGRDWVIPTLWSGQTLPDDPGWTLPVVAKARHGCNQTLVIGDPARDWRMAQHRTRRWHTGSYGWWLDEWLYRDIPKGCLIEPFIGVGDALPVDYKIYVFHGVAAFVQVHLDRASGHRWVVHDLDWKRLSHDAPITPRPSALAEMIRAAEALATDFSFARVDFYQPAAKPLFGEMTFYPGSGLDPFDPPELDTIMGAMWLDMPGVDAVRSTSGSSPLAA